jgi:hypothetical protein
LKTIISGKKITPNRDESMDEYRKAVVNVLKATKLDDTKLGGRELLDLLIRKWYSLILLKRIVNYGIYPLGV